MKQKKLTRKERQQLRDAELAKRGIDPEARRRQATARPEPDPDMPIPIDMEEARGLFVAALLGSAALADEPELEDVIVDPETALRIADEVDAKLDITEEEEDGLDDKEREALQLRFQEEFTRRLLTKELKKQIKQGVDKLTARLEADNDELYMVASAVQAFMEDNRNNRNWANVGLVQEIARRSVEAGLALSDLVNDPDFSQENPAESVRRLSEPGASHPFLNALRKIPGLRTILEKQADKAWDTGVKALWDGKLELGVFSTEELETGADIMKAGLPEGVQETELDRKQGAVLIAHVSEYLTGLFTSQRTGQLRDTLNARLGDTRYSPSDRMFIGMVVARTFDDDFVEYEMPFLLTLLFSEIRNFEKTGTVEQQR